MLFILIICVEILFSGLLSNFISPEFLQYIFILINFILMTFYLNEHVEDKKLFYIFFFGFFIRILILFIDIHVGNVPFSGGDTNSFHNTGIMVASNLPDKLISSPYGEYAQYVGIIYYLMGNASKIFVQFINIIFFILSAIKVNSILEKYNVNVKNVRIIFFILMFLMPTALFESAILLREMIIIFFVTHSVCYLLEWMDTGKTFKIITAITTLLIAGIFHSGVQFGLAIYIIVFIIYSPKNQKFKCDFIKTLAIIAVLGGVLILTGIISTDFIFSKIDIGEQVALNTGSAYLTNLKVDTGWQLLIYAPIKLAYFLFSPVPWMFRGIMDIASFILDSTVYILFTYSFFILFKLIKDYSTKFSERAIVLYILYFSIMIPYSWGTVAAGTAIRHRLKGIFIIILAVIFFMEAKNEKKKNTTCH